MTNFWPETWAEHASKDGMLISYIGAKDRVHKASRLCHAISHRYMILNGWAKLGISGKSHPTFSGPRDRFVKELLEILEIMAALEPYSRNTTVREAIWLEARNSLGDIVEQIERLKSIATNPELAMADHSLASWLNARYQLAATASLELAGRPVRSPCFG